MDCWEVTLNDLVLDGATPDGDGIIYTVEVLDGWFEPTTLTLARQPVLPAGEVVTAVRENARAIVLEFVASTTTPGTTALGNLIDNATETVKTAIRDAVFATVEMSVTDNAIGPLTAQVRRNDSVSMRRTVLGNAHSVRFQLLLLAEDPRRYDGATPHD